MTLHLVPVNFAEASDFVRAWHRHNLPTPGWKFGIGAADGETLVAVAVVGRPVAREYDDGLTVEVLRVASDGTRNANSLLYGATVRAAFALGYQRVVTYTRTDESGATMRAVGWRVVAERPVRKGWSTPSRPRNNDIYSPSARLLWEAAS